MTSIEPIVGRYMTTQIAGRSNRIYFEESGAGKDILCLHTAGADARQYRHFQTDPEIISRFRVVTFDLPWHGKSLPPSDWWNEEYLLSAELYVETVMSVIRALSLDKPIVIGCSMGGSVVLELARAHADVLGGVIGFSGASHVEGRFQDWSLATDVNSNVSVPSWTYPLMAPQSPLEARKDVWWIYAQGGPGVYRGDTYFYSAGLDLRGREYEIDTARCPVYLFTGEYDYACSADETLATIAAIPGAKGGKMKDIGHFPIAENYPLCREYLLPALDELGRRDTP